MRRGCAVRLLAVALALLAVGPVGAWDCNEAHPAINELAGKLFVVRSQAACYGDKYHLAPVEFRARFRGKTVDRGGLSEGLLKQVEIEANLLEWLARGGHDADMPALVMGFRHFYDPVYEPRYLAWLSRWMKRPARTAYSSEQEFFASYAYEADGFNPNREKGEPKIRLGLQPRFMNPRIDGITWAIAHPDNEHSWAQGLLAYKAALETPDADAAGALARSRLLGKAFRALGETLHMLGDMTQPAHVRADSHSLYDPIEKCVKGALVRQVIGERWKSPDMRPTADFTVPAGLLPEELMKQTAAWTNRHFFSNDTIADYNLWVFPRNHKRPYPAPALSRLTNRGGTYYATFADVGEVPLARDTGSRFSIVGKKAKPDPEDPRCNVTEDMAPAQARVLIPIAVCTGADLLDRFFPTLELTLKVERVNGNSYRLGGALTHQLDDDPAWEKTGEIRYAGHGELQCKSGRKLAVTFANGGLVPQEVTLDDGDEVRLEVAAGARLVRSAWQKLP